MRTLVAALVLFSGCASLRDATNGSTRQAEASQREERAVFQAWRGAPLVDLEAHPNFSVLPRQVQPLSDGSQLWTMSKCWTVTSPMRCNTTNNELLGSQTTCQPANEHQVCCHNQFVVRDSTVEQYRVVSDTGNRCGVDCSLSPASHPCQFAQR